MKKRIRQVMGSFLDFGTHLQNANEWAQNCATPKNCYLSFRVIINPDVSAEVLPYLWRIRGNVAVEVRKLRRPIENQPNMGDFRAERSDTIGRAKTLTIAEFYYIYCFLSDVKACAAHTVCFPEKSISFEETEFDDTECQICMDKKKQVALPCAHSFCLNCFQHWSTQSPTCPICRAEFNCCEGDDLWQLASVDVDDLGSYATDLVARIYEYLDKRVECKCTEEYMKRSAVLYSAAVAVKRTPKRNMMRTRLFSSTLPLGLPSALRSRIQLSTVFDPDMMLAVELASGEDQYAAMQHFEQLQQDELLAMAMQSDAEESPDES